MNGEERKKQETISDWDCDCDCMLKIIWDWDLNFLSMLSIYICTVVPFGNQIK